MESKQNRRDYSSSVTVSPPMLSGKAAALAEAIIRRHPFVDCDKTTTAMYVVACLLEKLGYKLEAEQKKLEDFIIQTA